MYKQQAILPPHDSATCISTLSKFLSICINNKNDRRP